MKHLRRMVAIALLAGLVGCGGGGSQDFNKCGNGALDTGESCDDGNLDDSDACTSACRSAACGDGVILAGVEECDGFALGSATCETAGRAEGDAGLRCDTSCRFDFSGCGPELTPTATPTRTATSTRSPSPTRTPTPPPSGAPTSTPTPTPTATPDPCGDGLLSADETCTTCPADCEPLACEPGSARFDVVVAFDDPDVGQRITTVSVLLAYRTSVLSLPGSAFSPELRQRIAAPAPPPFLFTLNDLDYGVRVIVSRATGVAEGLLFTASFDTCDGARQPMPSDLSCTVEGCSGAGTVSGCGCAVSLPEENQ